ncbi:transcription factor Ouib [Drosophila busckii]|nr:transcription factor Ouib [Drosophila busckii]
MLKNMCRTCGRDAVYRKSLKIFDDLTILWNLQQLTGLMLEEVDCLPHLICICCETELREAIRFRDRILEAQQEFLAGLTEQQIQEIPEEYKTALTVLIENKHQILENSNTSCMKADSGEAALIETISEDLPETEETAPNAEELMEYDIIINEEILDEHDEVESQETKEFSTDHPSRDDDEEVQTALIAAIDTDEDIETLDKVLSDELPINNNTNKKKSQKKRASSLMYICEECGNHISGRLAFELHCRRHRGDKQFECDICQDRFCTSSELKRHMRRHTGERPFACQYCNRCFTDYSTRVKHERTHTNERPYVCKNCGKAFTTAYILKNHMLIHSGERAFRCEPCDKSFIRQTHLDTHYRSSAHKRNIGRQSQEQKS